MIKILLIEDNEIDTFIAEKIILLSGTNVQLVVVQDGVAAITLLTNMEQKGEKFPDIILLDLYMQERNGVEFLESFAKLKTNAKHTTRVLVLTISTDIRLRAAACRLGASEVFIKPLSMPMFSAFVNYKAIVQS